MILLTVLLASSARADDVVTNDPLAGEFMVTIGTPTPGDPDAMVFHVVITPAGEDLLVEARWGETPMKARGRHLGAGAFVLRLATREAPTLEEPAPGEDEREVHPGAAEDVETYWRLTGRPVQMTTLDEVRPAVRLEGTADVVEVQANAMRRSRLRFTAVSALDLEDQVAVDPSFEGRERVRRAVVGDGRATPLRYGLVADLRAAFDVVDADPKTGATEVMSRGSHAPSPVPAREPPASGWRVMAVGVTAGLAIASLVRWRARRPRGDAPRAQEPAKVANITDLAALPADRFGRQLTRLKLRRAVSLGPDFVDPAEAEVVARFRAGIAALAAQQLRLEESGPLALDSDSDPVGHIVFNPHGGSPAPAGNDDATVRVPRKRRLSEEAAAMTAPDGVPELQAHGLPQSPVARAAPAAPAFPAVDRTVPDALSASEPSAPPARPTTAERTVATSALFPATPAPAPAPAVDRTVPTGALFPTAAPPPPPPPAPPPTDRTVPTSALFPAAAPPSPAASLPPTILRTVPIGALFPTASPPPPPAPSAPPTSDATAASLGGRHPPIAAPPEAPAPRRRKTPVPDLGAESWLDPTDGVD